MKKICILFILHSYVLTAMADHITGGEIYYIFGGLSGGQYKYNVTLKLFMICTSSREFNNPTFVSFFSKTSNARITDVRVPLARTEVISLTAGGPCITNPPTVCYRVGYYNFDVSLPPSPDGYIMASQVIYRVDGMKNLIPAYDRVGATYTAEIPGNSALTDAAENNSAKFTGDDLVVICSDNSFSYSFAASDADGDKLSYSFCNAYREVSSGFGGDINPPGPPPYSSVPYGQGYSGSLPLGDNVQIDPNTGLLTGVAPTNGIYVISVCVQEIRNNVVIATQRKDIQVTITSCSIAAASLPPEYSLCGSDKTIGVVNLSTSSLIKTYDWQFTNAAGAVIFTSKQERPSYTFPDTGIYTIQVIINAGEECSDTAISKAKVYPGFVPGFDFNGVCISKPVQFIDTTTSVYGTVNSWNWDFGDNNSVADFSQSQNPSYTYPSNGLKDVRLIVTDSKGCIDTVTTAIEIVDKPPVMLAFRDTLICLNDSVQLRALGFGIYKWSPNTFMSGANTSSPSVSPPVTTTYYADLDDNGCLNRDSVTINVVDHVELQVMNDTTICSGDAVPLNIISNGLQYSWTPASQLNNATEKNPVAVSSNTTTYQVRAVIGSCSALGDVKVTAVPYPVATTGNDTMICFQTPVRLNGITDGSSFTWTPSTSLQDPNTLSPIAHPAATTSYIFLAYDTKGCPKPGKDTITITVLPKITASAGRDTAVVPGQTLQLKATGGTAYQWYPATGLSSTNIADPTALYGEPSEGIHYRILVYNEAGCVDSASLIVKVYRTLPSVFVPTAFTPNQDGRNDILRPIAVGMQRIDAFNIYNRWGQLVFSTSINGKGWDGTISGQPQHSGVYVWMVKAVDYTGAPYLQRGTVTLIR